LNFVYHTFVLLNDWCKDTIFLEYASGLSFHKACGGGNDKDERISEQTKYYKKNFQKEIRLGGKWGDSFGIGSEEPEKTKRLF